MGVKRRMSVLIPYGWGARDMNSYARLRACLLGGRGLSELAGAGAFPRRRRPLGSVDPARDRQREIATRECQAQSKWDMMGERRDQRTNAGLNAGTVGRDATVNGEPAVVVSWCGAGDGPPRECAQVFMYLDVGRDVGAYTLSPCAMWRLRAGGGICDLASESEQRSRGRAASAREWRFGLTRKHRSPVPPSPFPVGYPVGPRAGTTSPSTRACRRDPTHAKT
jgi:hypothetical protein